MVLESLADTPCGTSHLKTLSVVLQSPTDTPCGTTVTHRHFLACYSHSQTLPVVLESVSQSNTSYGTNHSQTHPVVLVIHGHFLWYYSHWHTSCGTSVSHEHFIPTSCWTWSKRLVVWSTVSEQSLRLRQITTFIGKSDPPDCIIAFVSPLLHYQQQYNWKWFTPSNSTQTLPEHSLLPKYHTVSWYIYKCNFNDIDKKSIAFPCQFP